MIISSNYPKVSVLMAAYNAEKHIEESICSIINQSYKNFEFIIVNDGSTDNTASIIEKYAKHDKRICFSNQKNIGLTKTLIKLIDRARGLYIARMDTDDISHPERLSLQVDYLDNNQSVGVIGSWVNIIDEKGSIRRKKRLITESKKIKKRIIYSNQLVHGSVIFRKNIYQKAGGYDSNFIYSQDYDLWLRMINQTNITNYPEYLYYVRFHAESLTNKNFKSQREFAVNAIIKNVSHQKIMHKNFFYRFICKASECQNNKTDYIKIIVYARFLLRMGDYKGSAFYFAKMKNFEGRMMTLLLKSERVTRSLKKIYSSFNN
jgi:glycosyltransferase involved in cell wall biosynthesis